MFEILVKLLNISKLLNRFSIEEKFSRQSSENIEFVSAFPSIAVSCLLNQQSRPSSINLKVRCFEFSCRNLGREDQILHLKQLDRRQCGPC